MLNKKFKIRVRYVYTDCYVVEYANYFFIPIYYPLCFWFEQSLTGTTHCWSRKLMNYKTAEELAISLKSIEDIRIWYKKDEEKEKLFYKRQKQYYIENVPYNTKYFK